MSDSATNEAPPLPAPPGLPLAVVSTAPEAVVDAPPTLAGDTAPTRTGSEARWLADVALPFALGVVSALSWVGAAILALQGWLPFAEARAAQGALLLVVPVGIVITDIALNHDVNRGLGRSQPSGVLRVLLTLAVIVIGLGFAYLATAPTAPGADSGIFLGLPFAAPGFSLGVALGYGWGARPRPTGASVGLLGGLGFATPVLVVAIILTVMSHQTPPGCGGATGRGCGLEQIVDQFLALVAFASCALTIILGFIGGIMGAFFRSH